MGEEEARQAYILPTKKKEIISSVAHDIHIVELSYQYDLSTTACSFCREDLRLVQRKACTNCQETKKKSQSETTPGRSFL